MIDYKIDGYIEKTGEYDKNIINMKHPDSIFYTSGHLFSSVYSPKEKDEVFYKYFENDELFELDVDEEKFKDTYELQKFYLNTILEKVNRLELIFQMNR